MKKLLLSIIVFSVIALGACNSTPKKEEVPEKVKTAFHKKYPQVKKVKWEKEDKNIWEAEFVKNKREFSVEFSSEGIWKKTEYNIEISELSPTVKTMIDSLFNGFEIKKAEVTGNSERKAYEVELSNGKTELEIIIDRRGNVLEKKVPIAPITIGGKSKKEEKDN